MDEILSDTLSPRRFSALLVSIFAALALSLAAIGIYGVMSYIVTQRTSELGLRLALGAGGRDVVGLVLARAATLAAAGLAIGVGLSLAVSRLIGSLLFGLKPADPSTYAGVLFCVAAIAILAAAGPAWRASRIDPMTALRED